MVLIFLLQKAPQHGGQDSSTDGSREGHPGRRSGIEGETVTVSCGATSSRDVVVHCHRVCHSRKVVTDCDIAGRGIVPAAGRVEEQVLGEEGEGCGDIDELDA